VSISFFGLDIAITGKSANQKALEVTGHNVSNLGTEGYARQSAILVGAPTRNLLRWKIEMGVDVQQVRQIRDLFQDNLVRTASNGLGYWETRYKAVEDLQAIVGEPMNEGLQNTMNQFWDSWQELAKAPESLTIRSLVRQRAESLVRYVNHIGSQLNKLQSDMNAEIKTRIEEVNDITQRIRDLNIKIASAEAASNLPNDFYDQRNLLVDRISKLVTADVNVTEDGQMDIMVGGYALVTKGIQTNLTAAPNSQLSAFYTPKIEDLDIEVNVGQGIIKGLLEGRGEVSGAIGNPDNGSPNTNAEITMLVDTSLPAAQQTALDANVAAIETEMRARGLTPTITRVNYDGSEAGLNTALTTLTNAEAVPAGANRFLVIATDGNIGGTGGTAVDGATITSWINRLKADDFNTSIISSPADYAAGDLGEPGWKVFADQTNGGFYDIANLTGAGAADLFAGMGTAFSNEVDVRMATDVESSNIVSNVRREFNSLLSVMMRTVNYLVKQGTTLNGLAGEDFFVSSNPDRPLEMGNIKLNGNLADINNIVAGRTDANGDNTIALKVANLRNEMLMTGRTKALSLDSYYQNIILKIGNTGHDAESIMNNQRSLVQQADGIRQSIMGVSLDEEMGNMIKFKYAYNAASKNIKVVDEMIDTLVNRMGAGRG
jgi:flagellar hook-associated protein 1 FlgK